MVAFIAVCSQISIVLPSGIPLTFQTFSVTLCGYMLGVKWGTIATSVYILIGIAGIPVFSSFSAGPYFFVGPTGGFILGFIPLCALCGVSVLKNKRHLNFLFSAAGFVIFYFLGTGWYSVITKTPLILSFISVTLPFIIKDILCAFTAFFVAFKIKRKLC